MADGYHTGCHMSVQVDYSLCKMFGTGGVSDFGVFQSLDYLHRLYRFGSILDFQIIDAQSVLCLGRGNRN